MSYMPNARRCRVGAALIVLGLVAATLAIMPVAAAADTTVQVTQYPGASSYFDVSLGGGPSRPSFCVAHSVYIWVGPVYDANLYSIETLPPGWVVRQDHLDEVNWVLNHSAGYTAEETQNAIWALTDGYTGGSQRAQDLAASAPDGFVPGCGEYYLTVVTPFLGETKYQTVIVINQKPACHLTVVKDVINHGGTALPTDWTMNVSAVSPSAASFPGAGSPGYTIDINAGAFSVTESGGPATGYFQKSATGCSGTAFEGTYTCTITNEQEVGQIIIKKVTSPDDAPAASFTFDPSWGTDFSLTGGESHDAGALPAGTYSVAEALPLAEGWLLASATCDDGSSPASIGLSPGETVTCTFTNTYEPTEEEEPTGSLTVVKATTPAGGAGFSFDAGALGGFSLDDGGSHSFTALAAGAYTVTESAAADWVFESVTCSAATGGAVDYRVAGSGVTVNLAEGQDVTCTFSNREEETVGPTGSLTIIKQTVPVGGAGFSFDAGALGGFSLDDGGSHSFTALAAGAYTVTESAAADWVFESVTCSAATGGAVDYRVAGSGVTVDLAEGQDATCTFVNRAEQTGAPGQLPYTGSPSFMLPLLLAGLWSMLMGLGMVVWSSASKARA